MNGHKKLETAWPNTLLEEDYPKTNSGDVSQNFEDIMDLLHKVRVPSGIFLAYCVREIVVPLACKYYKKNYTTKYE